MCLQEMQRKIFVIREYEYTKCELRNNLSNYPSLYTNSSPINIPETKQGKQEERRR
jgi:hypothetical protein